MKSSGSTSAEYSNLERAFLWFNKHLFEGALPECVITFQRNSHAYGYYWHDKFEKRRNTSERKRAPEIALNPDAFQSRKDRLVMSTLVHEMVHMWQCHFGKASQGPYHNKEWSEKMQEIGLMPSTTGHRGGAKTGVRMSHYILRNGKFSRVWGELFRSGFRIRWQSIPKTPDSSRNKRKYSCPSCGINVWGAEGLDGSLACVGCQTLFVTRQ
jgi:predicted SprT family Zn-dependent metalloprotease